MSRIGKQPIPIPTSVTVAITPAVVTIHGPTGAVAVPVHPHVHVAEASGTLHVTVTDTDARRDRALWGLTARLLANAVTGVTSGFTRTLEVHGVGYRTAVQGATIELHLGFSHPIHFALPNGVTATVEKNALTLHGIDKQLVGDTAARIRSLRKPDAYHGKGIRYAGEVLHLKPGKAGKTGAATK